MPDGDLERTCGWIAAEEQCRGRTSAARAAAGLADRARHRRRPPRPSPRPHTSSRCRPAVRDTARRALAEGVGACTQCRPDTALDVLD
ncbi:DUF6233 domain-containing protein [Streptomyces sp. A1547]|uniref:DUF6233 domain-containing protein n=1 Tax=Streptomyces sp. A1547 TaxID=2563105 RepID=UPI000B106AA2|nr:DUF6233 domain-containing protein [Streptomyces sp. A1547]